MAKTERKAIKNYTTEVSVERTISEIQKLLVKNGAKRIVIDYDDKGISALSFMVEFKSKLIPIRLAAKVDRVLEMLNQQVREKNIPRKYNNIEQARRIMWRILLDWIDSQMTMVEIGQKELLEIFLPDICSLDGETIFEKWLMLILKVIYQKLQRKNKVATITICDICKKPMECFENMIEIDGKNYRLILKTIEDGRWKSKDVCTDCIRKKFTQKT